MNSEKTRTQRTVSPGTRTENVRNSSKKRKRKNRKRNLIIYFVLILLVVATGVGVSFTLIFNTREIVVENSGLRYTDEAIITASGIKEGDNMPSMNTEKIAETIEKQLPYIKKVNIKRGFNSVVTLSVEYSRPAVAFEGATGYIVLDSSGKVLETGVSQLSDYVAEVYGAQLSKAVPGEKAEFTEEAMFGHITGLVAEFEKAGYRNVTSFDFSDLLSILAEIDYRVTVKLGNIASASERLKFGKKVIDENLAGVSSARLVVDLSQTGTAYVRTEDKVNEGLTELESTTDAESLGEPVTGKEDVSPGEEENSTEIQGVG